MQEDDSREKLAVPEEPPHIVQLKRLIQLSALADKIRQISSVNDTIVYGLLSIPSFVLSAMLTWQFDDGMHPNFDSSASGVSGPEVGPYMLDSVSWLLTAVLSGLALKGVILSIKEKGFRNFLSDLFSYPGNIRDISKESNKLDLKRVNVCVSISSVRQQIKAAQIGILNSLNINIHDEDDRARLWGMLEENNIFHLKRLVFLGQGSCIKSIDLVFNSPGVFTLENESDPLLGHSKRSCCSLQ